MEGWGRDWLTWLLRSGRGAGKTRTGSETTIDAVNTGSRRIALIGQTKGDVRDTMIEVGESGILECSPPWNRPKYEPSKRRLEWPNGAIAMAYSGDEPDQLRGPQHDFAWVDELAKFKYPRETWDNLMLGLRIGEAPRCIVTTTPRPIKIIKEILEDPLTRQTLVSTYANRYNLAESFFRVITAKYEGTRLGRQELHGELLDDNPDALWQREDIDAHRQTSHPDLMRIVVAVDPEATANENSAETGIIVAGIGVHKGVLNAYILDDLTIKGSPDTWARSAVTGFYKHQADLIVAEANNGGDMVAHTINTVDGMVPVKLVHASRGKYIRAEPVAALYEQGRVHHIGNFADLEDQLCEWIPGDKSPDRLDALVWVLTELMLGDMGEPEKVIIYDTIEEYGRISPELD